MNEMNKLNEIFKIIYKYKNYYRNNQYNIYIYIGFVEDEIKLILNKIKNMSLIEIFLKLNNEDNTLMINKYGNKWYTYFFNYYHIKKIFNDIKNQNLNEYIKKNLNEQIFNLYFEDLNKLEKKVEYGYNKVFDHDM